MAIYTWFHLQADEQIRTNKGWTFCMKIDEEESQKSDHWLNRLISNAYVYECRCHCMLPLQQKFRKIMKWLNILAVARSCHQFVFACYHMGSVSLHTDNGTEVKARTYFATKPNKIKISTGWIQNEDIRLYSCRDAIWVFRIHIYALFFNLESLMVIFWFFFNSVAALIENERRKNKIKSTDQRKLKKKWNTCIGVQK